MKKTTAYLGLLLLFLTGVGIGITGHSAWMKERVRRFKQHGPPLLRENNMQRMTDKLKLTTPQREEIKELIKSSHTKASEMRKSHRKETYALQRETIQSINKTLTKKQREQFKKMLKNHFELIKARETQSGPPPGPPPEPAPEPTPQKQLLKASGANADNVFEPNVSDAT